MRNTARTAPRESGARELSETIWLALREARRRRSGYLSIRIVNLLPSSTAVVQPANGRNPMLPGRRRSAGQGRRRPCTRRRDPEEKGRLAAMFTVKIGDRQGNQTETKDDENRRNRVNEISAGNLRPTCELVAPWEERRAPTNAMAESQSLRRTTLSPSSRKKNCNVPKMEVVACVSHAPRAVRPPSRNSRLTEKRGGCPCASASRGCSGSERSNPDGAEDNAEQDVATDEEIAQLAARSRDHEIKVCGQRRRPTARTAR